MGASLVALDSDGKVVGYALTRDDGKGGIELVYLPPCEMTIKARWLGALNVSDLKSSKNSRSRPNSVGSQWLLKTAHRRMGRNAGRTPEPGIEMVVFSMRSVLSSRLPLGITLPVRGIFHNGA
ncbi:MAG: hypothetical protein QOF91_2283 [Alphaproteobacteria bacterium]|nr:hypothetical protein [Alphaproteobacteria bacterium]